KLSPPRSAMRGTKVFCIYAPRRPQVDGYSLRAIAKDRQNFVGGFRAGQAFAHRAIVQKLGDRGQRAQVRLELVLRDNKKNDELHRSIIQSIEFDTGGRSSKGGDDFLEPVRRTMRNGDPESDACAHGFLALLKRGKNRVTIWWLNLAKANEQIDQLDDGRLALRCFHLGEDLLSRK